MRKRWAFWTERERGRRQDRVERLEAADEAVEALRASSMPCRAVSDGDPAGRRYMACECGRRMLVGGGEAEVCVKCQKRPVIWQTRPVTWQRVRI